MSRTQAPQQQQQQLQAKRKNKSLKCVECKTDDHIRHCYVEGVIVCTGCGEVLQQNFVDRSAEWRNFSDGNQSGVDVRRGGGVVNPFLQQNGLGTMSIGGNSSRYSEFEKIMISAADRSYNLAQQNIKDWAHTLKLPAIISNKSMEYYEKVQTSKQLQGKKNINALLSAILFMAARHMDNAISPGQLCEVTGAKVKEVHRYFKEAKKVIPEHKSTNPKVFVNNFCNKLQLSQETNNYSQDISEKIQDYGIIDGKNPRTIASVSIFIGVMLYASQLHFQQLNNKNNNTNSNNNNNNNDDNTNNNNNSNNINNNNTNLGEQQKIKLQHLPEVANISEFTIKQAYKNIHSSLHNLLPQKFQNSPHVSLIIDSFPHFLYLYPQNKTLDYITNEPSSSIQQELITVKK